MRRFSRKEILVLLTAFCVSVSLAVLGGYLISEVQKNREYDIGVTSLSNCQQIENVKAKIRATVNDSLIRLPKVDYYKKHPEELKQALKDTAASVETFRKSSCYSLPTVITAGIKPHHK